MPQSGKIPHAAEQLGPCATITEPARLEPVLRNKRAAIVRGPCTTMKSGPRSPQLEEALAQKRRPNTAKNKERKKERKEGRKEGKKERRKERKKGKREKSRKKKERRKGRKEALVKT